MQNHRFIKFVSVLDNDTIVYALERDGVEKTIDMVKFIECTPDFERVLMVRADSLKPVGFVIKGF